MPKLVWWPWSDVQLFPGALDILQLLLEPGSVGCFFWVHVNSLAEWPPPPTQRLLNQKANSQLIKAMEDCCGSIAKIEKHLDIVAMCGFWDKPHVLEFTLLIPPYMEFYCLRASIEVFTYFFGCSMWKFLGDQGLNPCYSGNPNHCNDSAGLSCYTTKECRILFPQYPVFVLWMQCILEFF